MQLRSAIDAGRKYYLCRSQWNCETTVSREVQNLVKHAELSRIAAIFLTLGSIIFEQNLGINPSK